MIRFENSVVAAKKNLSICLEMIQVKSICQKMIPFEWICLEMIRFDATNKINETELTENHKYCIRKPRKTCHFLIFTNTPCRNLL